MSEPFNDRPFPRGALIAAAAMISLALLAAAIGRLSGAGAASSVPVVAALKSRELRFEDRPDGAVTVYEPGADQVPMVLPPGSNGFVRGVLRGLARDRRSRGIGAGISFRLTEWADGRLTLEDLATGRRIELGSFGATNREAFARLLTPAREVMMAADGTIPARPWK